MKRPINTKICSSAGTTSWQRLWPRSFLNQRLWYIRARSMVHCLRMTQNHFASGITKTNPKVSILTEPMQRIWVSSISSSCKRTTRTMKTTAILSKRSDSVRLRTFSRKITSTMTRQKLHLMAGQSGPSTTKTISTWERTEWSQKSYFSQSRDRLSCPLCTRTNLWCTNSYTSVLSPGPPSSSSQLCLSTKKAFMSSSTTSTKAWQFVLSSKRKETHQVCGLTMRRCRSGAETIPWFDRLCLHLSTASRI